MTTSATSGTGGGIRGLAWCATFVVLDAVQAVYLGGVLQRIDAFLLGALVFGLSAAGCLAWSWHLRRWQLMTALRDGRALAAMNVAAAGAWLSYFMAIQLIEPAVAFAIFCGAVPLATIAAWYLGIEEGHGARNRTEAAGNVILALGIVLLAGSTLLGWSGFVRGGAEVAAVGVGLAVVAGILITGMLLASNRLDRKGVGPMAQYGLRFPLYVALALAGYWLGIDDKGPVALPDIVYAVTIGMAVLAFPAYAVQQAVALTSPLTIGAAAAIAPLVVFALQVVEARVAYSDATSVGLAVYFAGAMIAAVGSVRATARDR
jgi:drug/metabolite transporter (DMT)-like permease